MFRVELLVAALFLMVFPSHSFLLKLSRSYGSNEIVLSEIELFNQGIIIPRDSLSIRYEGLLIEDVSGCTDGCTTSVCIINGSEYHPRPTIYIDSNGQFFDEIILHSVNDQIFGLILSVSLSDDSISFWEHRVADMKNIHVFDIHDKAIDQYPVKLVSTFSYNGESAALFHVQYLFPVVNQFIIVESRHTISRKRKPLLYFETPENKAAFAPYMSKITFLVVDEVPPRPADFIDTQLHAWMKSVSYDAFWVDHFQRAFVRDFIDRNSKTVYICTDADEIPSRELVASFRDEWMYDAVFTRKTIHIAMYMFYYNFHWAMPSMWTHAFAIGTERYLAQRDLVQSRVITDMEEVELVRGGWHLSYFLSREDIVRKVESFPHREYDLAEFKTDEHVTECLQMGKDMYKRDDVQLIPVDLEVNDHLWPQGWREYQQYVMRLQGLAP